MIEKISCIGYRGFSQKQELELAKPNGNRGSGLTVLVGPNGGGKSTIVECFSKLTANNVSFTEGKRNKKAGDSVIIEVIQDGNVSSLSTTVNGGSETEWKGTGQHPSIYYLPSRRVFNPYFSKASWDRGTFIHNPENLQFRGSHLNNFTYRLFDAHQNIHEFNKLFWKILGKQLHWTIDQEDTGKYYVKIKKCETIYHNSDGLGEGIISLMFIVDALFESSPNELIVIDEPELSLHPQLQIRLLNELLEFTKDRQIVISTHSPNMISIEAAVNGGVISRIFENGNGSQIACIDNTCRRYFSSYMKNIYNPHTIGSDARSCFFAEDNLIITEGQEDVLLFPQIAKQLGCVDNIAFFGFGAGGAANITQITYILKCLGFSHIGAIFDGDKEEEYNKFCEDYRQYGYKAWIIPADDIRDKKAIHRDDKKGILNDKSELKSEYKEEMNKIIEEIVDFSKAHI